MIVGVDDVEWLDAASARALEFALRRLEGAPIGVVVASRSEGSELSPLGLSRSPMDERVQRITIGPLGPEELRQILRRRLAVRFPDWVLSQIHEASGGNPLLGLELARALIRRGVDPEPGQALPIPDRLADLVIERLRALSDPERDLLLFVSASSQPTRSHISRAMGNPPRFRDLVDAALKADVLEVTHDRLQFTNPLLGTVLYAESQPEGRRRVHRMLADVASSPEARSRHLALAADGPDERVAQLLEDAAQRARSRGAPDAATELAELARLLSPPDHEEARTRRTSSAGRYAFESAQIERAEELLQESAAASKGPMRAESLLYLSRVHYHRRDAPSASALAEEALREARSDPSLEARINLELAAAAEFAGEHEAATVRARRALRLAERSGDRTITAESLVVLGLYEFISGKGVPNDKIERAASLQPGLPVRPLRSPAFYEACILIWSGDLPKARANLIDLERRARETQDESSLPVLLFLLSQIDSWRGNWEEAARRAEESRAVAEWTGQQAYLAFAIYAEALVASLRGEADRATALGQESLALARQIGSAQAEEFARTVLGSLDLARGDAQGAARWLSPLVASLQDRGDADPGMTRFVPDAVEALIELDEVARAEELLAPFEARAETLGRGWAQGTAARCRGIVLSAHRDLPGALEAFDRALEHLVALGQPIELGRTHLAKGKALRRGKQWASARGSLGEALEVFDRLGAALWADRVGAELGRIGGRTPVPDGLTETERRVADLVATGLTNREVAARLFLSVSTVESNLRRVYRKLRVRSRGELSHKLAGAGTSGLS